MGVSQASAWDGNTYTIDHTKPIVLPGILPLKRTVIFKSLLIFWTLYYFQCVMLYLFQSCKVTFASKLYCQAERKRVQMTACSA